VTEPAHLPGHIRARYWPHNNSYLRNATLGYSEDELRQLQLSDFTHPDDLEENLRLQGELACGKISSFQMEKRFIRKDGQISLGLLVASLLSDDSGIPLYFVGLVLDITDRKKGEEALRVSEQRFRLAMEATADGVWDWDLKTDNVFRSPGFFSMLGYQEEEFRGHFGEWHDLVHPEDLEAVHHVLDEYLSGATENYEVEFRMFDKSGGTVWILSRGKVVARDERGRPSRMVGTHSDITERKRAEEAMRQSEGRFRSMFQKHNATMLLIEPETGQIIDANLHAQRFYGYDLPEFLGMSIQQINILSPDEVARERKRAISGECNSFIFPHRLATGEVRTVEVHSSPIAVEEQTLLFSIVHDITERKNAEESLRRSQSMLARTESIAHVGSWEWDVEADKVTWSEELFRIFRRNPDDGAPSFSEHAELYTPEDMERLRAVVTEAVKAGTPYEIELRAIRKDGETRHCLARGHAEMGSQRIATRLFGSLQDITERKQMEEKLLAGASLLKTVLSTAPVGLGLAKDRRFEWVNEYLSEMTGYSQEELVGQDARILYETEEEFERVGEVVYGQIRILGTGSVETRWRRKDGSLIQVFASASAVDPQDLSAGVVFSSTDISAQKKAMNEIQRSHDETKSLLNGTKALLEYRHFQDSARGLFDICTAAIGATAGYVALLSEDGAENEVLFLESGGVPCSVDPSLPMPIRGLRAEAYRTGKVVYENDFLHSQWMEFMPDGHADLENVLFAPLVVGDRAVGLLGMANKEGGFNEADARIAKAFADLASIGLLNSRNMDALEESEERTRLLIESSPIGVRIARDGKLQYANPPFVEMFGYESENELIGLPVEELYTIESRESVLSGLRKPAHYEAVAVTKTGKQFNVEVWSSAITFQGKHCSLGFIIDVSEAKRLRSQLFQAQKMEAVGTLAGGVAHDFNNILQVALGYSELLLGDEKLPEPYEADLAKIHESAKRGSDLVQRLLTFSRKTESKPQPLDLNRRVKEVQKMLERTIPKMIEIRVSLSEDLSIIFADQTQVDQVLMNLAVNARDAMPEGGKLVIATQNVTLDDDYARTHAGAKPGTYVQLSVSDTGDGMDNETLQHIFEPFYTTKEAGKGTGLGLAMVYGIVKQHDGYIACYSEPGQGTTFKIYFPAVISEEKREEPRIRTMPRGGSETILLVDDEEMIRDIGSRILTKAGYNIITASNGKEALQVYQERGHDIALVILDLIMPEMGGKHCLENLIRLDPSVRVVIASGFSADGQTKEALGGGAKGFVSKPFDMRQLLQTVRKVLDGE